MMGENNETINLIDSYSVCINKNINEIGDIKKKKNNKDRK